MSTSDAQLSRVHSSRSRRRKVRIALVLAVLIAEAWFVARAAGSHDATYAGFSDRATLHVELGMPTLVSPAPFDARSSAHFNQ